MVMFPDGEHWVVQILDIDLASQGRSPNDALLAAADALHTQILAYEQLDKDAFEIMRPAPEPLWALAAARTDEAAKTAWKAVVACSKPYVEMLHKLRED
jgi:hypothetical protein